MTRHKYYETNKRNKEYYKSKGICINCCKELAEPNRTLCWECAEKDRNRERTYDKKRKSEYNKRKKELCDAFGICTTCMKRDKYHGKQCIECYLKRKKKYKQQTSQSDKLPRELWSEFERCMICGGERAEGSKLCKTHLEIARRNAEIARGHIDRENHLWRKDADSSINYTKTYTFRRLHMMKKFGRMTKNEKTLNITA